MKKNILNELGKRVVFFDGGMGTLLQARGLEAGELPENWNLEHPDMIRELHRDYLNAGADIILANTFGANSLKFPDNLEEIVTTGVQNAKKAVEETGGNGYVALDVGPTGKLLKPLGTLDFEDAVSVFARTIKAGVAAGADLILIERYLRVKGSGTCRKGKQRSADYGNRYLWRKRKDADRSHTGSGNSTA